MEITSEALVKHICDKISSEKEELMSHYHSTKAKIGHFFIDDLLPEEIAKTCYEVFPDESEMRRLNSIREYKYVSAQMNKHHPLLEKVLYAFQDARVVKLIGGICHIETLYADKTLYAGGLSKMAHNNFLNPHLDNSHDADRAQWRVLNLLYYVTPNWELNNGGHLELWPDGPRKNPIVIESKFNRLAVMATHDASWHSVNKVNSDTTARCCISNYYFSPSPLKETDKFHVTKYRGRPEETFKNIILDADAQLRMLLRKLFKKGIRKNPHIYIDKE